MTMTTPPSAASDAARDAHLDYVTRLGPLAVAMHAMRLALEGADRDLSATDNAMPAETLRTRWSASLELIGAAVRAVETRVDETTAAATRALNLASFGE
jgi:hypothetical protein